MLQVAQENNTNNIFLQVYRLQYTKIQTKTVQASMLSVMFHICPTKACIETFSNQPKLPTSPFNLC